jgi:hypothetical protein
MSAVSPASLAEDLAWTLGDITVDRLGQPSTLVDGIAIRYVLRGSASVTGGTSIKEGTFQLVVSAFQPSHDLPAQRAGRWYIRGDWSITNAEAQTQMRGQRHRQGVLAGTLVSEMDENPFAAVRDCTFPVQLPMTLTEAGWMRGKGSLALHATQGSGSITLVVSRRASVVRPPSGER